MILSRGKKEKRKRKNQRLIVNTRDGRVKAIRHFFFFLINNQFSDNVFLLFLYVLLKKQTLDNFVSKVKKTHIL